MNKKQQELHDLFDVVVSLLKDNPLTITLDSQRSPTTYTISKATQEQAAKHCATSALKRGNTNEITCYLQGMRDMLIDGFVLEFGYRTIHKS